MERVDPILAQIAELRREFEAFKTQYRLDLAEFRAEMKHEMVIQMRWMFAMWATLMIALIART